MNYALEIDEKERPVASLEELRRAIDEALQKGAVEIRLREDRGRMRGFEGVLYRVLGLSTEKGGNSVLMNVNGEQSSLVFLDADWNGYRAINPNGPAGDKVSFRLSNGQVTEIESRYVIPTTEAIAAIEHFFSHGKKPPHLRYKREKS